MNGSVVVKLGGAAARHQNHVDALIADIKSIRGNLVLVHGGGQEVSSLSSKLGLTPVFSNGIRMTSEEEMDVVEMVLSGTANKRLVRRCIAGGVPAVGISGADAGLVVGRRIQDASGRPTRTAEVERIDTAVIRHLWAGGLMPIVSSPSTDSEGEAVNINADDVAFAIAEALKVTALVFLSDVPGVLDNGKLLSVLKPDDVRRHMENGTITGGMIPKVSNALTAVLHGVSRVVIGAFEQKGDLNRLLSGSIGTTIEGGMS